MEQTFRSVLQSRRNKKQIYILIKIQTFLYILYKT